MFMIPRHAITVHRDGVNITPPIGKPFDFTDGEIKEVKAHNFLALRKPENETAQTGTEVSTGGKVPNADKTRDANVLSKAKPNAGGTARNQGGATVEEEDDEL